MLQYFQYLETKLSTGTLLIWLSFTTADPQNSEQDFGILNYLWIV